MAISTPGKLGIGVLALLGAFLFGFVPASQNARAARAEQDRLARELEVSALHVQLGMMSYEANRDNYGLASQMATPFFDGVRSAAAGPASQNVAEWLQAVLARRDEITADLAQANADVKIKIAELYADLFHLTQAPPVTVRATSI